MCIRDRLKTIGMTEKQIKRMIRKEGYRFCLFGIPAGITVGIKMCIRDRCLLGCSDFCRCFEV